MAQGGIPQPSAKVGGCGRGYDLPSMPSPLRRALPNAITLARLALAVVFFLLLQAIDRAGSAESIELLGAWAMSVFIVAAVSDIVDGYLARRWQVVSAFGRVMDPLVDKILVLGGFIYLASPVFEPIPEHRMLGSGIAANPYLQFWITAPASGLLELSWIDDAGVAGSERVPVTVRD